MTDARREMHPALEALVQEIGRWSVRVGVDANLAPDDALTSAIVDVQAALASSPSDGEPPKPVGFCPRDKNGLVYVEHADDRREAVEAEVSELNAIGSGFCPFTVADLYAAHPPRSAPAERASETLAELRNLVDDADDLGWDSFGNFTMKFPTPNRACRMHQIIATLDCVAAPAERETEPALVVDELAMMIGRLVRALRKAAPDSELPAQAVGLIQRRGLSSPLRAATPGERGNG
jgi:hypothetical protein